MFAADRPAPPAPVPGFEHVTHVWNTAHGVWAAKLLPGDYFVTKGDDAISTVLGSCVSACVRDISAGVGGMNHFMLPLGVRGQVWADERYGLHAMERLVNAVLVRGSGHRRALECKLVGGGRVMSAMTDIGRKNIDFARQFVATDGLALAAEDLGGNQAREVVYFPGSGRLRVRKLQRVAETVATRELAFGATLYASAPGNVELF